MSRSLGRPDAFRQLLISAGAPADASFLQVARAPEHKLATTLLSAEAAAGRPLRPAEHAELAANRHRISWYSEAWAVISDAAPDACVVKGSSIGALYPPGLLRAAGDMDVICPSAQVFGAARALLKAGWQLSTFTIFPASASRSRTASPGQVRDARDLDILVELSQPSDTEIEEEYAVELRTVEVATSILKPAKRLPEPLSPVAGSILALVAERWERPFRTRDVYDLAVLSDHLDPPERASLCTALTAAGLWPEMRELSSLLARSGLRPALDLPDARRLAWRASAARLAQSAVRWSNPVRVLGYLSMTTADTDRGALADRLAAVVHERIGAWRLLRLGLPLFGVPIPPALTGGSATGEAFQLVRLGPHLVALTPVGLFLMTAGSCPESWLAEAASGLREVSELPHR